VGVLAVIGDRYTGGFGAVGVEPPLAAGLEALGAGVAAATPPVVVAKAGVAATARIVKLQKIVLLRVRTRTTTTSFVGLRG
jgi:hypothetical protein